MTVSSVLMMPNPSENRRNGPGGAGAPAPLFSDSLEDRALFAENFDGTPFQFRHCLHQHPAFQLSALLAAAERLSSAKGNKSHYESGEPDRNAWFGARPEGTTLVEALASIQSGRNWVILKRIHEDPTYRDVLLEIIPELSVLAGVDMRKVYYDPTMTIFVTSPGRITPYHMDGETNFLAQIHGTKKAYIYNGDPDVTGKTVLSHTDLEKYWTGSLPKIDYPDHLPHGHWQYTLAPGNGVFNPAVFPHWLENGSQVSVSVSINFKRRNNAMIGAYRTNRYLRRMGLHPTPPCESLALDRAKQATFGRLYAAAEATRTAFKKRLGK